MITLLSFLDIVPYQESNHNFLRYFFVIKEPYKGYFCPKIMLSFQTKINFSFKHT